MRAFVTSPGLNIRKRPDSNAKSLDKASYGEELVVLDGADTDWPKVRYLKRNIVGYVYADYIRFEAPKVAPPEPPFPWFPVTVFGLLIAGSALCVWLFG